MQIKANMALGGVSYQFSVDEKDEMDTLHKIIIFTNPPRICNECGKGRESFYFTANKDKEANIYINIKCVCGAKAKLGQYKSGGYFWHEFEKYIPKATQTVTPEPALVPAPIVNENDDPPF